MLTHALRSARFVALLASFAIGAACALLPRPSFAAEAPNWVLDPEHVSVSFRVDHVGYAKTLGLFRRVTGRFRFDEDSKALSDLRVEIDADSVYTANERRDKHLRSDDFLEVRRFPKLLYTARGARRTGERTYVIDGELTLLGRRLPVTLQATLNKSAPYPLTMAPLQRSNVLGVSAQGRFKRSAFGMTYGVENGWVGDEVELNIEIEARRE